MDRQQSRSPCSIASPERTIDTPQEDWVHWVPENTWSPGVITFFWITGNMSKPYSTTSLISLSAANTKSGLLLEFVLFSGKHESDFRTIVWRRFTCGLMSIQLTFLYVSQNCSVNIFMAGFSWFFWSEVCSGFGSETICAVSVMIDQKGCCCCGVFFYL